MTVDNYYCDKEDIHKELKKHVSIIHCSNSLSLLQRKISNALLFHAYPVLQTQEEYYISIKELCNYVEYCGHNYDAIKQALKALISTVIEWNIIGDKTEDEDWTASSILASINIKGAICTYAYSPRMRQLLYSPSMYGKINLSIQSNFTSSYGLALYENCVRYRNLYRTKIFPLSVFRKIMGVQDDKYLSFNDFKKRVINKAVEEVNTISDLIVQPSINRVGKKIINIYFNISEKKGGNAFSPTDDMKNKFNNKLIKDHLPDCEFDVGMKEKLKNIYSLNIKAIEELIKKYGVQKIEEKLKQIEATPSFSAGKILNLAGFLIDALKKDYVPSQSSKVFIEEKRIKKEIEEQEKKNREREQNKIINNYERYIDEQLNDFLNSMDSGNLNEIKLQFEKHLLEIKDTITLKKFSKNGFINKAVRVIFRIFLNKLNSKDIPKFVTFEQFQDIVNKN